MALPYTERLAGQSYSEDGSGYTFVIVRRYDVSSVDTSSQNVVDAVMDELPARRSLHPTIFPSVWLNNRAVKSSGDSEKIALATLTYVTPSVGGGGGASTEDYETWEWSMVAQQTNIVSAPSNLGGVLEWNKFDVRYGMTEKEEDPADEPFIRANEETGEVQGADVYRGTGALRVTKYYADKTDVPKALRKTWEAMEATTNDAEWIDWTEGEILYLGATISYGVEDATVQHQFLFGDTKTDVDFEIAPASGLDPVMAPITVSAIRPWHYVWQEPCKRAIKFTGTKPQKNQICPRNLKIAEVYDESDFSDLGLVGPETGS